MLLAIDSSAGASAAVVENERVLASWRTSATNTHAEVLASAVQQVLAQSGVEAGGPGRAPAPAESGAGIRGVVVGVGPGPFTGLRAGMVLAHTLAEVWEVPIYGVSSLDSLAHRAVARGYAGEFLVATDARRREVYWARYSSGMQAVDGPYVSSASELPKLPVFGVGAGLYPEDLQRAVLNDAAQSGPGETGADARSADVHAADAHTADPRATDAHVDDPSVWLPDAVELSLLAGQEMSDPSGRDLDAAPGHRGYLREPRPLYLRESDAKVPQQMKRATA